MPLRHKDCEWACPASHYLEIHRLLRRNEFDSVRLVLTYFDEFSVMIELRSPSLRESISKVEKFCRILLRDNLLVQISYMWHQTCQLERMRMATRRKQSHCIHNACILKFRNCSWFGRHEKAQELGITFECSPNFSSASTVSWFSKPKQSCAADAHL
jgi:hypothetical protein